MEHNLLTHIITGEANLSEKEEFYRTLADSKSEEELFYEMKSLWIRSSIHKSSVDIDDEFNVLWNKITYPYNKSFFIRRRILHYAAIVLFVFSIGGFLGYLISKSNFEAANLISDQNAGALISQEIATIYGTRSKFQLSDGTTVHLNSGSKLIFPLEFKGIFRKVELVGEAFFDVTHNPDKPFIVKTSAINAKVLGTSFNMKAYPESNEISTTLVDGKIILERETSGISKQLAELKPSDRAVFKTNDKVIDISAEEDLDKFIAWKDGKLVFFNDPVGEVAEKLGIWYNVTVKIENNNLKKYRFTATFTDEPIEQVLDLLGKSSSIKYRIKKAKRLTDNSYSKREIILN